jgi:hypothetical protein
MAKFNLKLSREVDKLHDALSQVTKLPPTPLKVRKLLILRKKLAMLERRIKV